MNQFQSLGHAMISRGFCTTYDVPYSEEQQIVWVDQIINYKIVVHLSLYVLIRRWVSL